MRSARTWLLACAPILLCGGTARADDATVEAELQRLKAHVERFATVDLPTGPGEVVLSAEQSVTVEDLRGVPLDAEPPVAGAPAEPYPPKMTDSYPPGEAPYIAGGIEPFRFRYFNNEFSYGGWHNWGMCDYASTHGFSILSSYNHAPSDWTHVPPGTQWLKWGGLVNWTKWLPEHGIDELRYDVLADMDVLAAMLEESRLAHDPEFQSLMIDMEHPRLTPEKLREQTWYPAGAGEAERLAFERKYYEGYAQTYVAPVEAARRNGWRNISVYGWQPFARTWWGLEKAELDPATDWAWNSFGKAVYEAVDILNPSVYCFYWSPENVAYTLANLDLNIRLVATMPQRKPVRPYYWTLLHGGGGGERWWQGQPIADEDVRAMIAFCFFTGCDGLVLWNWSGTGNHHRPQLEENAYVMVGQPFELKPEGAEADVRADVFQRYDVLHVTSVAEDGTVRFQRVDKEDHQGQYGLTEDKPRYAMPRDELARHVRVRSEPVAALIEGLALVKPFEYLLRNGEAKIDVPAQQQYAETLPIVRRVRLGSYHVLGTYDPLCVGGQEGRQIRLADFDGHQGLTLVLPADAQTRIFVVREL